MALANHRTWLLGHAEKLFSFFERRHINPLGGFFDLDEEGRPTAPGDGAADKPARYRFATSRIVHAYAIAYLMAGQTQTSSLITESFLWNATATPTMAGTYWGVGYDGLSDPTKQ